MAVPASAPEAPAEPAPPLAATPTSRVAATPATPIAPPLQVSGAQLSAAGSAVLRSGRAQLGDWDELREVGRAALWVVLGWLAMTIVTGFLAADALRTTLAAQLGSAFALGDLMTRIVNGTYGVVGSLLAGLGYHLSVSASAGAYGLSAGGSGDVSFAIVPLGSLLVLGLLSALGARSSLRRRPVPSAEAVLVRVTLVAAAAALALYVVSMFMGIAFSGSGTESYTGASLSGSLGLSGGPTFGNLFVVLFPVLWLGAAVGGLALSLELMPGAAAARSRLEPYVPMVIAGLGGYAIGLVVVSFGVCLGVLFLVATNGGSYDPGTVGRLVPGILAFLPNVAAFVILAGSGTSIGAATTGVSTPSAIPAGSIWQAGIVIAGLSVLALLIPGFLAGTILRGRAPGATPGKVAAVAALVGLLALIGASMALPSANVAAQTAIAGQAGSFAVTFDLGQTVVLGGIGVVISTFAGFQFGAPLWPALEDRVPQLGTGHDDMTLRR
ncbi:MAG: hypothetical protein ACP5VP_10525 [Candidatus Limnocylindrales bacterium]